MRRGQGELRRLGRAAGPGGVGRRLTGWRCFQGPSKFRVVALDPKIRTGLAKEGRLWLVAALCAVPGAAAAQKSGDWWTGAAVFAACFAVLGPLLWLYERRKKRARAGGGTNSPRQRPEPGAAPNPQRVKKPSVSTQHGQQKRNKPENGPQTRRDTDGRGR